VRGTNNPAKVEEGLFIDLISIQQVGIVAKVSKKPMELPQRPLGAIQSAEEGPVLEGLRLQDDESEFNEWFLWVPLIPRSLHTNQKNAIETGFGILVS
jgi:hypothetical protein